MRHGFLVKPEFAIYKRNRDKRPLPSIKNNRTLNKEVKGWMKASVKHHWFLKEINSPTPSPDRDLWIYFTDPQDAMLYKLSWG